MAGFLRRLLSGGKKVPDNATQGRTVKASCATGSAAHVTGIRSEQFGSIASQKSGGKGQAKDTGAQFIGKTVGGIYQIRGVLGRGGMGIVFRAYNPMLDREVALKVPFRRLLEDENNRARVLREAKAAAQLQHSNIVPVYEAREDKHCLFYIASALIEGQTLEQEATQRILPVRETALIVRKLAEALAHAHSRGIVHRDVKPGNVMLDNQGEPMLTDFGLARIAASESQLTRDGTVLGTPAYMSPEQVKGRQELVGPATDQYSLGAVLYRLLCGQLPFIADFPAIMHQVLHRDPPTPRSLNPQIPIDLEVICLKTMAKEPEHRYAGCQELADDLRRWLDGYPIQARRIGPIERLYRWSRRNPVVAALVAATAVLLIAVAIISTVSSVRTSRALAEAEAQRHLTEEERSRSTEAKNRQEQSLYNTSIILAHKRQSAGEVKDAERVLDGCPVYLRHWEWGYLKRLCHLDQSDRTVDRRSKDKAKLAKAGTVTTQEPLTLQGDVQSSVLGDSRSVRSVMFSGDGKYVMCGANDGVALWDLSTQRKTLTLPRASVAALSPDGRRIVAVFKDDLGRSSGVKLWNTGTGQECVALSGGSHVSCLAFSPDGKKIIGGGENVTYREISKGGRKGSQAWSEGAVYIWDSSTGVMTATLQGENLNEITCVAFSPNGKWIAGGSWRFTTAIVWDALTGRKALSLHGGVGVRSVAFSPDSKWIVTGPEDNTGAEDNTILVWDASTGNEIQRLSGHSGGIQAVAFSPDCRRLISGSDDRTVKVWDMTTGQDLLTIRGHSWPVTALGFSGDGKRIVSGARDGAVKIWDGGIDTGSSTLWGHTGSVMRVAFSADGKQIISGADDGAVREWNTKTLQEVLTIRGPGASISNLAFSPDGTQIARAFSDSGNACGEKVVVWDVTTGQERFTFAPRLHHVACVAFGPDGRTIAIGGFIADVTATTITGERVLGHFDALCVLDAIKGQEIVTSRGDAGEIVCVAFSPDGTRIATNSGIYDASSGKRRFSLDVYGCTSIVFSHDGRRIACGTGEGYVGVVDASTGAKVFSREGHKGVVFSVAFSTDDARVVSASLDKQIKMWDVVLGQEIHTYVGHKEPVYSVAFSPDGTKIVSGSGDHTVKVWDTVDLPTNSSVSAGRLD